MPVVALRIRGHLAAATATAALAGLAISGCSSGPTPEQRHHEALRLFAARVAPPLAKASSIVDQIPAILVTAQATDHIALPRLFQAPESAMDDATGQLMTLRPPAGATTAFDRVRQDLVGVKTALPSVATFIDGKSSLTDGQSSVSSLLTAVAGFRTDRTALLRVIGRRSSPDAGPTPTLWSPGPASSTAKVARTLSELIAFDPPGTFVSRPINTAQGQVAVVARPTTDNNYLGLFDLAVHDTNGWRVLVTLGKGQNIGEPYTRPKAIHVTTSLLPDFQVFTAGGDYSGSVIVSDVGGSWHLVPFKSDAGSSNFEMPGVTISGLTLTAQGNNCVPDCADGTPITATWQFYPPSGDFTPSG